MESDLEKRTAESADREAQPSTDLELYLIRQWEWSRKTFGPGKRTMGVTRHIEKEVAEIRAKPYDLSEWVDVIILAMDGYWRHGGKPGTLLADMQAKQDKNFGREWPEPSSEDESVEHVRDSEDQPSAQFSDRERLQFAMEKLFIIRRQSAEDCAEGWGMQVYDTLGSLDDAMRAAGLQPQAEEPRETITMRELVYEFQSVTTGEIECSATDAAGIRAVLAAADGKKVVDHV